MEKRGKRIQELHRILKRRKDSARRNLLGIDREFENQPHRLAKIKAKFTRQRGSLKEWKQEANRAARARARQAIRMGKEPPVESRNSVRWDYW